ncbi:MULTISPECIES: YkvA family protein [unclassified Lysobacter]|uniref:YkvA family protein n=1 Tax=unclassified Lysobacter TaxID=2635362 RepID=UPI001C24B948|nr:YkvA family protein [Lysobacter sp. MMG2]MBU8977945.1 DUF1232 domain-containing protein [Lysobacter sp. MMG2]
MPLTINIDLSDEDLQHFAGIVESARQEAADKSNAQVVEAAVALAMKAQQSKPPQFVKDRLEMLDALIAMLRDEAWALSEADAANVRSALAYFVSAGDAIPDNVPVLGFIDDAIMIELCARELKHEIEAYNDFCDFRQREADRRKLDPATVGRADWLENRREELQDRMHQRRSRDFRGGFGSGFGTGYGGSSSYGPVSRYSDSGWRPGPFRFR